jgi:hypothetical protein
VTETTEEEIWVVKRWEREKTYGVALGGGRYRITATALTMPGRIRPGAVVETHIAADGTREFLGMVSHSPLRSASMLLDRTAIDSVELEAFKSRIVAAGGQWEQVFGGIFLIHVPRGSDIDPRAEIAGLQRSYRDRHVRLRATGALSLILKARRASLARLIRLSLAGARGWRTRGDTRPAVTMRRRSK